MLSYVRWFIVVVGGSYCVVGRPSAASFDEEAVAGLLTDRGDVSVQKEIYIHLGLV